MVLKKTILEIFHDYFATEELKAEAREGSKKEEIDLSDNIGMLTGTSHSLSTDEYVPLFHTRLLILGLRSFLQAIT